MKNLDSQLKQLKSFIINCTTSAKSINNYTDFKRINECLHNCFPEYINILEIDSPEVAEKVMDVLIKDKLFLDYDERGKKQYSNTLYTYVRF